MLSDQQFNRLTRSPSLPRKPDDRRQKARVPYTAGIKIYPIVGKNNFESSISVRCRDLSPTGAAFLSPHTFPKGANLLMKFPGLTADHPLNVIGSVVRVERLTSVLNLIGVRFDAVPSDEHLTPSAPVKVVAEPQVPAMAADISMPATSSAVSPPPETSEAELTPTPEAEADAELARIRAAVLF